MGICKHPWRKSSLENTTALPALLKDLLGAVQAILILGSVQINGPVVLGYALPRPQSSIWILLGGDYRVYCTDGGPTVLVDDASV